MRDGLNADVRRWSRQARGRRTTEPRAEPACAGADSVQRCSQRQPADWRRRESPLALAFGAAHDIFDVVQAADQAQSKIEAGRAMRFACRSPLVDSRQSSAKRVIDDCSERPPLPLGRRPKPSRDIVIQCECGAHDALMLWQ